MAVRRISDLPELYTNYPDAQLSNCLLEVSYNPVNQIFQSFYTKASNLMSAISNSSINSNQFKYAAIDIAWPIGSIYIASGSQILPPGALEQYDESKAYGPIGPDGKKICWTRCDINQLFPSSNAAAWQRSDDE